MTPKTKNETIDIDSVAIILISLAVFGAFLIGLSVGEPQDNRKTEVVYPANEHYREKLLNDIKLERAKLKCEKADGVFKEGKNTAATSTTTSCIKNERIYEWDGENFILKTEETL